MATTKDQSKAVVTQAPPREGLPRRSTAPSTMFSITDRVQSLHQGKKVPRENVFFAALSRLVW